MSTILNSRMLSTKTLTLDDFRALLGKKNDGNIMPEFNGSAQVVGLHKANYGFFNRGAEEDSPLASMAVRKAFYEAIANSAEGNVLPLAVLKDIKRQLGLDPGATTVANKSLKLMRDQVKDILDQVDREVAKEVAFSARALALEKSTMDIMACDPTARDKLILFTARDIIEGASQLKDVESQMALLPPKKFLGHSAADMRTFLKQHGPEVVARLLENTFWETRQGACYGEGDIVALLGDKLKNATNLKAAFQKAAQEIMESFSRATGGAETLDARQRYVASFMDSSAIPAGGDSLQAGPSQNDVPPEVTAAVTNLENLQELVSCVDERSLASIEANQTKKLLQAVMQEVRANPNLGKDLQALVRTLTCDLKGALFGAGESKEGFAAERHRHEAAAVFATYVANTIRKAGAVGSSPMVLLKTAVASFHEQYAPLNAVHAAIEEFCSTDMDLCDNDELKNICREHIMDLVLNEANADPTAVKLRQDVAGLALELFKRNCLYDNTVSDVLIDRLRADIKNRIFEQADAIVQKVKDVELEPHRKQLKLNITADAEQLAMDLKIAEAPENKDKTPLEICQMAIMRLVQVFVGAKDAQKMSPDAQLARLMSVPEEQRKRAMAYLKAGLDEVDNDVEKATSSRNVFRDMVFDGIIDPTTMTQGNVDLLKDIAQVSQSAVQGSSNVKTLTVSQMFGVLGTTNVEKFRDFFKPLLSRMDELRMTEAKEMRRLLTTQGSDSDLQSDNSEFFMKFVNEVSAKLKVNSLYSFPTTDMAQIMRLFASCGLVGASLDSFEGREKVAILVYCASINPDGMTGLKIFCENLFNKPFADVTLVDLARLDAKTVYNPATQLQGEKPLATWKFLSGSSSLAEIKVSGDDALLLAEAARELAKPGVQSVDLAREGAGKKTYFNGTPVTLEKAEDGTLTAVLKGVKLMVGKKNVTLDLRLPVALSLQDLRQTAENELIAHGEDCKEATRALLTELPNPPLPGTVERTRELYTKTIKVFSATQISDVVFAGMTAAALREAALDLLEGKTPVLGQKVNGQYMGASAVELHRSYVEFRNAQPGKLRKMVKMPPTNAMRSVTERKQQTTSADVHQLVADLFMNADTWDQDEAALAGNDGLAQPGARLQRLLRTRGPELANLGKEGVLDSYLKTLPDVVRDRVSNVLQSIIGLYNGDKEFEKPTTQQALAEIDDQLAAIADTVMGEMQATIKNDYFQAKLPDNRPVAEKTFSELTGGEGLDLSTTSGLFAKTVLDGYFANATSLDKRKWLSAFVLNTTNETSPNLQVAELLKGAGPLLQKMLQGLPIESFNAETQQALKDMKSQLPPIPEEAVKAQLLECVRASGGKITSIEVKKSLGAASVAQAFLCNIKTPEHPVTGIDCVVKVLRPTAAAAMQREKAIIDKLLADVANDPTNPAYQMIEAVKADFEARYAGFMEELDFTIEAQNVELGVANYDQPKLFLDKKTIECNQVHAMHRVQGLTASTGALIVELAPGKTLDRYLEDVAQDLKTLLREGQPDAVKTTTALEPGGDPVTAYTAQNGQDYLNLRKALADQKEDLLKSRAMVAELSKAWFDRALFGDGFFHGDMHAGNGLISRTGVTVIDFGNCTRMSKAEQDLMLNLFVLATGGNESRNMPKGLFSVEDNAKIFLEALGVSAPDAKLLDEIADVFAKGTGMSALERIQGAFTILQRRNIAIPPVCSSFVSSLVRLGGIVSALDAQIQQCDDVLGALRIKHPDIQADALPNVVHADSSNGASGEVKSVPSVFVGLVNIFEDMAHGASLDTVYEKFDDYRDGYDLFAECGGKIHDIIGHMEHLATYLLGNENAAGMDGDLSEGLKKVLANLRAYAEAKDKKALECTYLRGDGKTKQLDLKTMEERVNRQFGTVVIDHLRNRRILSFQNKEKSFAPQDSFAEMVGDMVVNHMSACKNFMMKTHGLTKAPSLAGRMMIGLERASQRKDQETAALEMLNGPNAAAAPGDRLLPEEVTQIRRTIKDFYAPQDCFYRKTAADASIMSGDATITDSPVEGWGAKGENRTKFLKMLDYNMGRLEKNFLGMKLKLGKKHWQFAFALHAQCETANFDASMIGAVKKMPENDYLALLAEVQSPGSNFRKELVDVLAFMRDYELPKKPEKAK